MTAQELMQAVRIDGNPILNVEQITIDGGKTTVVYSVAKESGETAQRVLTVETGAVSFG